MKKENKFGNKTYFRWYPSNAIPPQFYGVTKVHKTEKKIYPMRAIMSTVRTAPYGTSKYLVDIIQPTLNKNKHGVINSSSFVYEVATSETTQKEIQVSHKIIRTLLK